MKLIFSLLITGFSFVVSAQLPNQNKNLLVYMNNNPIVYLDSIPTDLQYFHFNPDNIARTDIEKGKIYITSINPKSYHFLSFADLKNKFIGNSTTKPVLLLLNGMFFKNPSKINIDSSYIDKVEVDTGEDYEQLKNLYPFWAIVNIKLKNSNFINGDR